MPRKKSPDPKDFTMSARFTKAEAEEIDAARGSTDRGPWLHEVALAAARPPGLHPLPAEPGSTPPTMPSAGPPPRPRKAPAASARCPHRLSVGAYCKTCERTKT